MKITQSLIREVKRSNALKMHPQAWHDFQGLREVEAINWAIEMERGQQPTPAQIVARAKEYLDSLNAGNKEDLAEIGAKKRKETEGRPSKETVITNNNSLPAHNTQKVVAEGGGDKKSEEAKIGFITNNKPDLTPAHDTRRS